MPASALICRIRCRMPAIRCSLISLACLLCPTLCLSQYPKPDFDHHTTYHFVYFQVPGAAVTNPSNINDSLAITGSYSSSDGLLTGGFVRTVYGQLTTFDVGKVYTGELQINAVGEIAGVYQDVSGEGRGFIRSANGSITKFNPGGTGGFTDVRGINHRGNVVGIYSTTNSVPRRRLMCEKRRSPHHIHYPWERLRVPMGHQRFRGSHRSLLSRWRHPGRWVRAVARRIDHHLLICYRHCSISHQSGRHYHWLVRPTLGDFQGFVRRPDGTIVPFSMPGMGMLYTLFMGLNEGGFITGSYTTIATGPPGPARRNTCTALYGLLKALSRASGSRSRQYDVGRH